MLTLGSFWPQEEFLEPGMVLKCQLFLRKGATKVRVSMNITYNAKVAVF